MSQVEIGDAASDLRELVERARGCPDETSSRQGRIGATSPDAGGNPQGTM